MFFFFKGLHRGMSFSTFNHAPPNLCCKHVLTDSLKELIASNNLTIWLGRSIPARLLALQRLGPIQAPAMLLWCRETEWEGEREVVRLARTLKRGGNDKDHHLLLMFLAGNPGRQQRLHRYDPSADRRLECYWKRGWGGRRWRKQARKASWEQDNAASFYNTQFLFIFLSSYLLILTCNTNNTNLLNVPVDEMKFKWAC